MSLQHLLDQKHTVRLGLVCQPALAQPEETQAPLHQSLQDPTSAYQQLLPSQMPAQESITPYPPKTSPLSSEGFAHSSSPCQDSPSQDSVKTYLKSLAHCLIRAINTRDFTIDSPLWSFLAPSFRASPHPPHRPLNANLQDFLQFLAELAADNPEWKCCATETTVYVDGKEGEVFMNVETEGIPVGIVTRSCAIVKFREMKKGWRCVGYEGVNGGPGLECEGA